MWFRMQQFGRQFCPNEYPYEIHSCEIHQHDAVRFILQNVPSMTEKEKFLDQKVHKRNIRQLKISLKSSYIIDMIWCRIPNTTQQQIYS